jgi:hypothetical protein
MTDDKQTAEIERIRRIVAWVLGSIAVLAVVSVLFGLWPTALVDEFAPRWFGRNSLRVRLVGAFCVYGLIVIAALLPALVVKTIVRRLRR